MTTPNDFITNLGSAISQQFSSNSNSDNKNRAIDIAQNGIASGRGSLGRFSNAANQAAERSYTEEGAFRNDFYNSKPKQLDVLMQDPDVTVLVKKRAFASLAENFRTDLMDQQEKLFLRATKVLFQNKCRQIAAYEALTKISVITTEIGRVDYHLLPIIFAATDALTTNITPNSLSDGQNSSISESLLKFKSIVDRAREIVALSQDNFSTTWITNVPDSFRTNFAEGTGVIEFTNVTSLTTTTSIKFGEGSFTLNFTDPYELMLVTNLDIEQAINDATNRFYNNSYLQFGINALDQTIATQKRLLYDARVFRGVNPLTFFITQDQYIGQKVKAIINNIGFNINFDANIVGVATGIFNIDPSALQGSTALGDQGLSPGEVKLFNSIISMIYNQIGITANNRRQSMADNQDPKKQLNAIRKKLRLHYANKLIIQPMDNVNVFIKSKKQLDTKIVGALQSSFAAQGFIQGINNLAQDIKDTFAVDETYLLEKSMYVGNDFPNWLWQSMRSQFVGDRNGAHVFAGIVDVATSSYNNGAFTASVSGPDNAGYFNYGVVNFKPSVDVFNGGLYDPLTPFKLEFDSTTGAVKYPAAGPAGSPPVPDLLDENKGIFSSAFVRNKNGLLAGLKPTEATFSNQDADRLKNNSVRRVFYDPDGMVYRWKEGIGTLVLFGDSYEPNPSNSSPPPSSFSEPFAGQGIVNALSLLIAGEPYDFATFYKAAIQFDNFKRDPSTNQSPSNSYFKGLQNQLKERNAIYGNFIPYKQLTIDDPSFVKMQQNQLNAIQFDAELNDLIQQRAALADTLAVFGKTTSNSLQTSPSGADTLAAQRLNGIDQQINDRINNITNQSNSKNSTVNIVGNDSSFDYDASYVNSNGTKTRLDDKSRRELRRKLAFLTRRLPWKVRANEDVNFLIVDDSYDKDYDIQAFEKTPTNPEMFKSEYITVADKINTVKSIIGGIEVFANTQGHIEIRNPKYNRVPSSVFLKMLRMKNELGVQIFPQFLEDLYTNQVQQLYTNIEVLEDEIRLYCLALGNTTDNTCISFITSFGDSSGTAGTFQFLSSENTGTIAGNALNILLQSQPDTLLSSLTPQAGVPGFNTTSVAKIIQANVIPPGSNNTPLQFGNLPRILDTTGENSRQQLIINRLQGKTGQQFDFSQLFNNTSGSTFNLSTLSSVDLLQITNGIVQRLSDRQRAIKLASNAIKNVKEGLTLFEGAGGVGDKKGANSSISQALYNSRSIPQVFEHMIEDETYDDLGINSSKRYVIKNHDILNYTITEKKPPFTSIEVSANLGDNFVNQNQLPQDLKVFQQGNAITTAAAIDYDLWRMYGLWPAQPLYAPYLSDPNTQCAPYAVSLLNVARKEILSGSVNVIGNEYQQPGEVVYLENRDLLFYVESVTHQFTFGRSFSTSMNINYGHNPGEYIPTFLDVIGKILYKNKDIPHLVHKRQGNVFNQEHLGTIIGNTSPIFNNVNSSVAQDDITNGPYGDVNRLALTTIINQAGPTLSLSSDTLNPTLEIRIYYNSEQGSFGSPNSYAQQIQNDVLGYLIGANSLAGNTQPTGSPSTNLQALSAFKSQIIAVNVDGNPQKQGEFRYPSVRAFHYAREVADKTASNQVAAPTQQQIDNVIYNYVVDCWIVFNNPQNSNSPNA